MKTAKSSKIRIALGPDEEVSSVAKFWDTLHGVREAQSCEFLRMDPQFLLCRNVQQGMVNFQNKLITTA